jgi:hypothetical protein
MSNVATMEKTVSTRIFARQMARELSHDEVKKVSGGMRQYTTCRWDTDPNMTNYAEDDC